MHQVCWHKEVDMLDQRKKKTACLFKTEELPHRETSARKTQTPFCNWALFADTCQNASLNLFAIA
jgi:hypothetical protein